jgi:anti-sigma B factor antagonist
MFLVIHNTEHRRNVQFRVPGLEAVLASDPPDTRTRPTSGPIHAGRDARLDVSPTLLELETLTGPRGEMLVVTNGEIDMSSAPTLLSGLDSALRHPSCRALIVDLRGVQFLGACPIAVFLAIRLDADTRDVRLALVADQQAVLRPLQITATTDRLTVEPTQGAADRRPAAGRDQRDDEVARSGPGMW